MELNDCLFVQVAQATSKQMSKRDPLRPYMDVIDDMLAQMVLTIEYLSLPHLIKDLNTESVLLSLYRHNFQIFSLEKIHPSNHKVDN